MTIPNCATRDCYGALVATTGMGLFQSKNVIVYDDSHPAWEHKGQVLPITRIDYDYRNPKETQVCMSGGSVWLRRASVNDDWIQVLTTTDISLLVQGMGYAAPTEIGITDVKYIANGRIFVMFGLRGTGTTGAWFLRSLDYGNTWTAKYLVGLRWRRSCGMGIQYGTNAHYARDQIIFAGVSDLWFNRAGFIYSKDQGVTWGPVDSSGNLKMLWQGGGLGGYQAPVASRKYIGSCYIGIGRYRNLHRLNNWTEGSTINKDSDYLNIDGTTNADNVYMYHPSANRAYICDNSNLFFTWTLESALPNPLWGTYTSKGFNCNFTACTDYAQNMLYGYKGQWRNLPLKNCVWGTDNDFADVFPKSGELAAELVTDSIFDTESIPANSGGTSRGGIAMYLDRDTEDDDDKPPTPSGWPIWLTAGGTEMRRDPSGDRLYVVAETDWPDGDGLWQQPLLFQFILSGTLAGVYYNNVGHLAFMPTLTVGGSDIYSGSMSYNGLLEMHTEAPLSHGVVVVGKFDENKQVYYNDAIHAPAGLYTSGWPVSGWDLVGTFGSKRVTSVAQDFTLVDDMTISHTDMATVSGIATTPWLWSNKLAVPFLVNTQLREGNNAFVGVEGAGETEPIQLATVISGLVPEYPTWVNRGIGLPEVQINRIKRSDA